MNNEMEENEARTVILIQMAQEKEDLRDEIVIAPLRSQFFERLKNLASKLTIYSSESKEEKKMSKKEMTEFIANNPELLSEFKQFLIERNAITCMAVNELLNQFIIMKEEKIKTNENNFFKKLESANQKNRSTEEESKHDSASQRCSLEKMVSTTCRQRRQSLHSSSCTVKDTRYVEMLRKRASSLNTNNLSTSVKLNKLLLDDGSRVFEKMKRRLSSCSTKDLDYNITAFNKLIRNECPLHVISAESDE